MNQQRYRQAVRSIHWSAQQRAEIEARNLPQYADAVWFYCSISFLHSPASMPMTIIMIPDCSFAARKKADQGCT